jgi:hypothetical protein
MNKYYPYKSDKPNKKYFIITNDNKKVYFDNYKNNIKLIKKQAGYSDFTIHKDEERKLRYIKRHNNENWSKSGINSAGFWSKHLLWNLPTITASYQDIKKRFNI